VANDPSSVVQNFRDQLQFGDGVSSFFEIPTPPPLLPKTCRKNHPLENDTKLEPFGAHIWLD
jgi:hypothetical protein